MSVLEQYMDCMVRGDNVGLADLFNTYGVLHDTSVVRLRQETIHLEGKMAIEMMFHHRFGFNGGPFKIRSVQYRGSRMVSYCIFYNGLVVPVVAILDGLDDEGKIKRLNIYPM